MPLGLLNGTQSYQQGGSSNSSYNYSTNDAVNWASTLGSGASASQLSQQNAAEAARINRENMQMVMEYNAREALKQREWEENMSNTAYQRAVKDLKAAGINPILAAGASASTPSGAVASTTALQAQMAREYTDSESYGESHGRAEGTASGSSWEYGESTTNLANQAQTLVGKIADLAGIIKDTNSSKKISNFLTDVNEGIKGAMWNFDQNVKSVKQWLRNVIGLDK